MSALKLNKFPSKIADESEKRFSGNRRQFYQSENIKVTLKLPNIEIQSDLLDVTPEGMGVILDLDPKNIDIVIPIGMKIRTQIDTGPNKTSWQEAQVVHKSIIKLGSKEKQKLGIAFLQYTNDIELQELRKLKRFNAKEDFAPTAYCMDPLAFNEKIFFKVSDISAEGLCLTTSIRNKTLVPGTRLKLSITVPLGATYIEESEIVYAKKMQEIKKYQIGVKLLKPSSKIKLALNEYLFSATDCSLKDLREQGFKANNISAGLTFRYINTQTEWDEMLKLRLLAYQNVGKFADAKSAEDMLDVYDSYARQIIGISQERTIASGRVVFIDHQPERCEHVKYDLNLPEWVFKEKVCEFSRASIHPEYRSSEVFVKLLQHFGRIAYQGGCKYVLANCNDNLWPVYKSTGFKKMGITFDIPGIKNCHLIYADVDKMMQGRSGKLLGWNQIVYPIAKFLKQRNSNKLSDLKEKIHSYLYVLIKKFRQTLKK